LKHLVQAREQQRKKRGLKRRYNTFSYQLQRQAEAASRKKKRK
jgi:hypothetical protein